MRYFYERHRAHATYVRSDQVTAHVRHVFPDYDEATCRRHLDQLARWQLIRLIPEQSKPANFMEIRQRPRVYQAERVALRLEELRVQLEAEDAAAASINPAALEQLISRLAELVEWSRQHFGNGSPEHQQRTHTLWHALYRSFQEFARSVEDYLSDLPRHRPKESLDYAAFQDYRDTISRYLSAYIRRLFDRREYVRHLLGQLSPRAEQLVEELAEFASQQVRADGTCPDRETKAQRYRSDLAGLTAYFAEGGDVDVLLEQAQGWIADITRHARRLSEQHLGGAIREQTFLDLGRLFAQHRTLAESEWLAQVAFGATTPLHWKGAAPEAVHDSPWRHPPVVIPLHAVRRGSRQRVQPDVTADTTMEQLARMQARAQEREQALSSLLQLFDGSGRLLLDSLHAQSPEQRQHLLRLIYRALSRGGEASVGHGDWRIRVLPPADLALGRITAPDGELTLPRYEVRLLRGGTVR